MVSVIKLACQIHVSCTGVLGGVDGRRRLEGFEQKQCRYSSTAIKLATLIRSKSDHNAGKCQAGTNNCPLRAAR